MKDLSAVESAAERRGESRIRGPFPALALDLSPDCEKLGVYTVLEDFSASGFHMLLERPAGLGECLVVITQISQATVMLQGTVVRVEAQEDGTYGLGVAVKRHQIFSLKKIAA
jgi:PilZ domain